ncbi:MAG: hypothetical protein LBU70_02165 [Chitinispirillales bacterium]|jgi:hypothetical protein|nr:hypothetical protein [Chitinispirillales bacterium]
MKKFFLAVLVLALSVSVASATERELDDRVGSLQAQVDDIMAKAGIHFSGEFRSQFLSSTVDGDAVDPAAKKNESVNFTSVDFDITARPNSALSARAMFRLHQDWRNFFSDVQNPITARWISIDGALMNGIVNFSLGDYKKKVSPLTLWTPEVEFMFEPELFANARQYAMSEAFLGDNNRVLQGGTVRFEAGLDPLLNLVEADFFAARLAIRGSYESSVNPPGTGVPQFPDGAYFDQLRDKYLVGGNLGAQIVEGAGLGLTYLHIFDAASSFNGDSVTARAGGPTVGANVPTAGPAQSTGVFAGRVNVDNRAFMDDDFIRIGVNAEVAFSSDKHFYRDTLKNADGTPVNNPVTLADVSVLDTAVTGLALNVGLSLRVALDPENSIRLSADFISNAADFRNDAAQSPSYMPVGIGRASIMNSENGLSGLGIMNPFDAMYRSVFKFAPSQYFGGARPYTKNAYTNAVLTPWWNDRNGVNTDVWSGPLSPFQTALPGGMASADRVGPVINLSGSFLDNGVNVGVKTAFLQSHESRDFWYGVVGSGLEQTLVETQLLHGNDDFLELVAGLSADIAKFAPAVGPSLVISGSYGMYNSTMGYGSRVHTGGTATASYDAFIVESTNGLISLGLDWQFHRRFSAHFGYQLLNSTFEETINGGGVGQVFSEDYTFSNLSFGLGYRVADGGMLTARLTMVGGEGPVGMNPDTGAIEVWSYTAMQPELFLTVRF